MAKYLVQGGLPLAGTTGVHGAKNSILPVLAGSLLNQSTEEIRLKRVPMLGDVRAMVSILTRLGARVGYDGSDLLINTADLNCYHVPDILMREMRSSIFLMGPLLGRLGRVQICYPGGCAIGDRPINLHLEGLGKLGATVKEKDGYIEARGRLRGGEVGLTYPSVGATENLMLAAVSARGDTVIYNAACEPEIVDLQNFLNTIGANISGAGTPRIRIRGGCDLHGGTYRVFPDRIVTGTLLLAGVITRGSITVTGVIPEHLTALLELLREAGVTVEVNGNAITVEAAGPLKAIPRVVTGPYPGFPTDLQPQFLACLALAQGESNVVERVFESRFHHIPELCKMGAQIELSGPQARLRGVDRFKGAVVRATDLRAGAALVMAALAAAGNSEILEVKHIERGYDQLPETFAALGARITREEGARRELSLR
ncbi:MAG TPA: UDP-N-acetylglucosamine 1-carboxyvinyltransferase [Firmicutes bacterium]|nr:UDP-N-acetylglucosamine 1-carboxyvinyltransferase [Bacillota bacterium]